MAGEGGVAPALLPGDLTPEPRWWKEASCIVLRIELDFYDEQPFELTAIHVDFGEKRRRIVEEHVVSRLVDSSSVRVCPELFGLSNRDGDINFGAREASTRLHRDGGAVSGDADSNLHAVLLGEVALPDGTSGAKTLDRRHFEQEKLPFDLDRHSISMERTALPSTR